MNASDYEHYVGLLEAGLERPAQRTKQLDALVRKNGEDVKAAERQHWDLEAQVAKSNDDLRRVKGRVEQLARSASVSLDAPEGLAPLASLAEAEGLMKSMAGDLRSAEDAVEWLKRARVEQPRPAQIQAPAVPSAPTPVAAAPQSGNRMVPVVVGIAVALVIVVLLVVLVL